MSTLFLDIETLPTDRQDVRDYIAASISPPGNISKPETIAKWIAESKPAAIDEAIAKTSLDGAFGRVCVIGWALDDERVQTVHGLDEPTVLQAFSERIDNLRVFDCTVVGHNVTSFDLRFLVQRYIVNGIKPPAIIARAAQAKPWEAEKVYDTMVQWAGTGNRISLDKLCMALGIDSPKGDITGATVGQAVADGRLLEVADYCAGDVDAVREVWRRMTFRSRLHSHLCCLPGEQD